MVVSRGQPVARHRKDCQTLQCDAFRRAVLGGLGPENVDVTLSHGLRSKSVEAQGGKQWLVFAFIGRLGEGGGT